jgi:hypothetical protein
MFDAYMSAGAPAQLQFLPPYGTDGHALLLDAPTDIWWPAVSVFLASLNLPTSVVVELPAPSPLPAPQVNDACLVHRFHETGHLVGIHVSVDVL